MARSVGVPVCLLLPLQPVPILTHEESCLAPAEMDLLKFPAPSSHLFLFLRPLKRKEICNTADSSLSLEFHWSSDSSSLEALKNHSNRFQPGLPCFTEVFGCLFACCQIGVRWESVQKCKQHISSPGSVLQSFRLLCQHARAGCEQVKKPRQLEENPCVCRAASFCVRARVVLGIFMLLALSMFQYLRFCRCRISGPNFGMGTHRFYKGHVEIWQYKLSVELCLHPLWILNTGICENWVLTELIIYIKANSVIIFV